ncbi:hypothetical protein LTR35_018008 [Friedmanniomyces endolithicus]|nr:hypothetical protein LTR35_018008 [Friedmanniomyces endolithicus]KAK0266967.1 hypothetical protein LTS00_017899 [Friedmanniomyces endolithicus]KAK0969692.1 hypothetical protein LTR54_018070 [Friedmanniomyces endolithicus]
MPPKTGSLLGTEVVEKKVDRDPTVIQCLPTQCIFCMGERELPVDDGIKAFHSRDDLKRHFHGKHRQQRPRSNTTMRTKTSSCKYWARGG